MDNHVKERHNFLSPFASTMLSDRSSGKMSKEARELAASTLTPNPVPLQLSLTPPQNISPALQSSLSPGSSSMMVIPPAASHQPSIPLPNLDPGLYDPLSLPCNFDPLLMQAWQTPSTDVGYHGAPTLDNVHPLANTNLLNDPTFVQMLSDTRPPLEYGEQPSLKRGREPDETIPEDREVQRMRMDHDTSLLEDAIYENFDLHLLNAVGPSIPFSSSFGEPSSSSIPFSSSFGEPSSSSIPFSSMLGEPSSSPSIPPFTSFGEPSSSSSSIPFSSMLGEPSSSSSIPPFTSFGEPSSSSSIPPSTSVGEPSSSSSIPFSSMLGEPSSSSSIPPFTSFGEPSSSSSIPPSTSVGEPSSSSSSIPFSSMLGEPSSSSSIPPFTSFGEPSSSSSIPPSTSVGEPSLPITSAPSATSHSPLDWYAEIQPNALLESCYLVYHPGLKLVICQKCSDGIPFSGDKQSIISHAQKHCHGTLNEEQVEEINKLDLHDAKYLQAQSRTPPNDLPPLPVLAIHDTCMCGTCGKIGALSTLQKHFAKHREDETVALPHDIRVQSLFRDKKHSQPFRVYPAVVYGVLDEWERTSTLNQADIAKTAPGVSSQRHINPLNSYTGWHQQVAGINIASLMNLVDLDRMNPQEKILQLNAKRYVLQNSVVLRSAHPTIRRIFNTSGVKSDDFSESTILTPPQERFTLVQHYGNILAKLILMAVRSLKSDCTYKINLSDEQRAAAVQMVTLANSRARDQTLDSSLDAEDKEFKNAIHDFTFKMVTSQTGIQDQFQCPVAQFIMLINLGDNGGFRRPINVTSDLSALSYVLKLNIFIEWCIRTMNITDAKAVMAGKRIALELAYYTSVKNICVFSYIKNMSNLASSIIDKEEHFGPLQFHDATGLTFTISGYKSSIEQLRQMYDRMMEEGWGYVEMLGFRKDEVDIGTLLSSLNDNPGNETELFSFLQDERNTYLKELLTEVKTRYLEDPQFALFSSYHVPNGGNGSSLRWIPDLARIATFTHHCDMLVGWVAVMTMLFSGTGAPRAEELATVLLRNGLDRGRGVYVLLGHLCVVIRYHKKTSWEGADRLLLHYLPPHASAILALLIGVIRPFLADVLSRVNGDSGAEIATRYQDFLFITSVRNHRVWEGPDICREVERYTEKYMGFKIGVAVARQAWISFQRHFFPSIEVMVKQDAIADLQAGHKTRTADRFYGIILGGLNGSTETKVYLYFRSCKEWWCMMIRDYCADIGAEVKVDFKSGDAGSACTGHTCVVSIPAIEATINALLPHLHTNVKRSVAQGIADSVLLQPSIPAQYVPLPSTIAPAQRTLQLLRDITGVPDARFRSPQQSRCIELAMDAKHNFMQLAPTSSGKTLTYAIPVKVELQQGGLTVVIVPLKALLDDIGRRAAQMDIPVVKWIDADVSNTVGLVLMSVEEAATPQGATFIGRLNSLHRLNRIVLDEVQEIPLAVGYRDCMSLLKPTIAMAECQKVLLSGTVSPKHERSLLDMLGISNVLTIRTSTARPELRYSVCQASGETSQDRELKAKYIAKLLVDTKFSGERGVVFCRYTMTCVELATMLQAPYYHAKMPENEKVESLQRWLSSPGPLIATKAIGVGVDFPSVRYTIHCGTPSDLVSFAQESGRGGRDGNVADSVVIVTESPQVPATDDFRGIADMVTFLDPNQLCRRLGIESHLDGPSVSCIASTNDEFCDLCSGQYATFWASIDAAVPFSSPNGLHGIGSEIVDQGTLSAVATHTEREIAPDDAVSKAIAELNTMDLRAFFIDEIDDDDDDRNQTASAGQPPSAHQAPSTPTGAPTPGPSTEAASAEQAPISHQAPSEPISAPSPGPSMGVLVDNAILRNAVRDDSRSYYSKLRYDIDRFIEVLKRRCVTCYLDGKSETHDTCYGGLGFAAFDKWYRRPTTEMLKRVSYHCWTCFFPTDPEDNPGPHGLKGCTKKPIYPQHLFMTIIFWAVKKGHRDVPEAAKRNPIEWALKPRGTVSFNNKRTSEGLRLITQIVKEAMSTHGVLTP
ncbi:hypothetical protein FRC02_010595 [Tulasnella sp. 418]|nr:hypothetical protein FRC02_010595 [Tulasnella sp. 418]